MWETAGEITCFLQQSTREKTLKRNIQTKSLKEYQSKKKKKEEDISVSTVWDLDTNSNKESQQKK